MATGPLKSLLIPALRLLALLQSPRGSEHRGGVARIRPGDRAGEPSGFLGSRLPRNSTCCTHSLRSSAGAPSRKHHHPADGQAEGPGAPTCAAPPSPLPLPSSASLPPPSLLQTYLAPAATSFLSLQVTPLQAHSFQALPDPPGPSSWIGPSGRGGSGARSRCPLGALQDLPARVRPAGSNL